VGFFLIKVWALHEGLIVHLLIHWVATILRYFRVFLK